MFSPQQIRNYRDEKRKTAPVCATCARDRPRCARCQVVQDGWAAGVHDGGVLVCSSCVDLGYTITNLKSYACHACEGVFGCSKFPRRTIQKYKEGALSGMRLCTNWRAVAVSKGITGSTEIVTQAPQQ